MMISVEMFGFVRYDLRSNVMFCLDWFGLYRKMRKDKAETKKASENDRRQACMSFRTLPIPAGCKLKFNISFKQTHMELHHAVATHINEHGNLGVKNITFSSCIEYFCISGQ